MTNQKSIRKNETLIALYRFSVCCLSFTVMLCSLILHLSRVLSQDKLSERLLFSVSKPIEKSETESEKNDYEAVEKKSDVTENEKENNKDDILNYDYIIKAEDMGCYGDYLTLRNNETDCNPDTSALLTSEYPCELTIKNTDAPAVLVIHTHATECYAENGALGCNSDSAFRCEDTEKNVVKVGTEFCKILEENGIKCIHCTTLHDAADYNKAYESSLESVKYYLNKYPTIKYIFDIHRDAIFRSGTEAIKPLCAIDGQNTAQIMLVCGTSYMGADHPDWQDNLSVCLKLQKQIYEKYPGLMRKIDLRGASFNQQYSKGFMLVEVGSCANTLSEAISAVRIFAACTADMINKNGN